MASTSFPVRDSDREYLQEFSGGTVRLEMNEASGLAVITLDHPERRNALSGKMMVELSDRIGVLESWRNGKAVILRGAGGNFCSGGDLNFARAAGDAAGATLMSGWMLRTLSRLRLLPLLSVCIVEGPTLGGGAELSVACDHIVAAANVQYGFVHAKMGIVTAWGGTTRLANKIGDGKALELLLTARILSADECLSLGIADAIVSSDTALKDTELWLAERLQHDASIIRAYKQIVAAKEKSQEELIVYERGVFVPFWGGELNRAALAKKIKHVHPE